ncbi:MAG: SpoIIE family protein phosphatase [Gemmataceae bacterium]|nr:SpoIIE family protein phosphatase [Gemmataceae bacterium]
MAFLRDESANRDYPLSGRVTLIGRDPGCDIVLGLLLVSGRHAAVFHEEGAYYLQDLGSRNGTALNGMPIRGRVRLGENDRLALPAQAGTSPRVDLVFHEALSAPPAELEPAPTEALEQIVSMLDVAGGPREEVAAEAKLRAVLEIARTLGNSLDLEEVLPKILMSLFTIFPQAEHGFILLRDPSSGQLGPRAIRHRDGPLATRSASPPSISRTVVNHALTTRQAILSADAGTDARFDSSQSIRGLSLRSVLCVPMFSQAGEPLGVIQLDTRDRLNAFRPEDLDVLLCASTQAARAVELAHLHQEQRDLEAATRIQHSFLPDQRPAIPGLHFFDHYSPAKHVGGDYYDYVPLPGDRLAVALGDVAGKGVSAALLMARLSATARFCLATSATPAQAARRLNADLARAFGDDRLVTFVVAVLDLSTFTMTLVNAGHLPPLRRRADGSVESVGEGAAGLPLAGIDRPYEQATVPLEPGDTLLLYSDGITEMRNPAGEFYGQNRLRAAVRAAPVEVEALGEAVLADVRQFAADRPQGDDLTLVCFGRR